MYRDDVNLLINEFEQRKVFFDARIPYLYEQLANLVHLCRQLQCFGERAQARQLLSEKFFRLFGVTVGCTDDRPISVLAAVMRHVLISGVRLQRSVAITNDSRYLVGETGVPMSSATQEDNQLLLALDLGLGHLAQWYPDHVNLLEMRYFARLALTDMARELEVTCEVVEQAFRFARASLVSVAKLQD